MGLVNFNCLCSTCCVASVDNVLDCVHCAVGGMLHVLRTELDADGSGVSVSGMDGVA